MTSLTFAESHPIQEVEYPLPKEVINVPHPIIPAEMMPADHLAMQYFQYYFANIHPFVPVINSTDFYKQWRVNPKQISPLILEGIFACASQTMSTSVKGSQWLALAAREYACHINKLCALNHRRPRGKLQRRSTPEHIAGTTHSAQGQGNCA